MFLMSIKQCIVNSFCKTAQSYLYIYITTVILHIVYCLASIVAIFNSTSTNISYSIDVIKNINGMCKSKRERSKFIRLEKFSSCPFRF